MYRLTLEYTGNEIILRGDDNHTVQELCQWTANDRECHPKNHTVAVNAIADMLENAPHWFTKAVIQKLARA